MWHLTPVSSWGLIILLFVAAIMLAKILASSKLFGVQPPATAATPNPESSATDSASDQSHPARPELYDWAIHGL